MVPFGSNIGGYNSLNNVFGLIYLNFMSTMKRCPIGPSCEIPSRILLNSMSIGGLSFF